MTNHRGREPTPQEIAAWRSDLIKRLVPVAISVGFAGRLINAGWLVGGRCPTYGEWQEIPRLLAAIIIVLLSWEWYHRDIIRRPTENLFRFILDIIVIVVDFMFLYASSTEGLVMWSFFLFVIFALYVVWDVVSIFENAQPFLENPAPASPAVPFPGLVRVYSLAIGWPTRDNRGPIITLVWTLYFFALFYIVLKEGQVSDPNAAISICSFSVLKSPAMMQALVSSTFSLLGILFLLLDANARQENFSRWSHGRFGIAIALGVLYWIITHVIVSLPTH
jgi:hypothetical protein